MTLKLNNTYINMSEHLYPYRAYISALYTNDVNVKACQLAPDGFKVRLLVWGQTWPIYGGIVNKYKAANLLHGQLWKYQNQAPPYRKAYTTPCRRGICPFLFGGPLPAQMYLLPFKTIITFQIDRETGTTRKCL